MSDQENRQLGRDPSEGELPEGDLDAIVGGKQTARLRIDRFGEFYLRRSLKIEPNPDKADK